MGKVIGDAADPLLVSVRSGAKFSMPGMMDTVLNLGLNDESVEGLAKQTGGRALRLRLVPALHRHVRPHRARAARRGVRLALRRGQGAGRDHVGRQGARPSCCATSSTPTSRSSSATPASPSPRSPTEQLRGAIEAVFRSWNGPRAIAYRERERIAHDLGTAVNVQAMVFGNRDDNSGTGVGFTRDPATGAKGAYGDFLVNAQGEDVVAGIRNTEPISELKKQFPKVHARAAGDLRPARGATTRTCATPSSPSSRASSGCSRPGWASAPAPPRSKMAVDMVRAERPRHLQGRGGRRGSPRTTSTRSSTPSSPARATRSGPRASGASPGRRRGADLLHRRRRRGGGRARRAGRAGAQRDLARGRARHAGLRGDPDRPRRPGQPRRRRGPRLGQAGRGRRRGPAPRRPPGDGRRHDALRGRLGLARRGGGHRGGRARCRSRRPRPRPRSTPCSRGPTRSARATWPCGPTPTPARTPPTPARSAPRASACAGPSTCSSARTACPSCAG